MQNKLVKIPFKKLRLFLAGPLIWVMIIPLVILDIVIELYHRIDFPLYGIKTIKRSDYIKIDRQKLSYLNPIDKIWCFYCSYANGLLNYSVKIAGETEKYWCGIKHKQSPDFHEPAHHKDFIPYGDEEAYSEKYGDQTQ
jgi:hypothetical protein